jgi:hypothetical protein
VLQLAGEGRIDTVQLDIKDESGEVGYLTQVPLAQEIGAANDVYNPREALDQLHAAGAAGGGPHRRVPRPRAREGVVAGRAHRTVRRVHHRRDVVGVLGDQLGPRRVRRREPGEPALRHHRSFARDFATLTKDSATAVIPWLQAFSLRHSYGVAEVRAQIDAAESNGIKSFILWDPNCRYTQAADLERVPRE